MQSLNSKNYQAVYVSLRDQEQVLVMNPVQGQMLMDYLTKGDIQTKHVKLTDRTGSETVVLISDIKRVDPVQKLSKVEDWT